MNSGRSQKKILYIGMDYYHYPKMIVEGLEALGFQVDFYPIEPRTIFYKSTRYIAKKIYRIALDMYHSKIINKSKSIHYDKVFFIASPFFSKANLEKLKMSQKNAEFISYHWDSLKKDYSYLDTRQYFSRVYSFDKKDCVQHDLLYLPLFASGIYANTRSEKYECDIDIYIIGSVAKLQRYFSVCEFEDFCRQNRINFFSHLKVTPITYMQLLLKKVIPKNVSFFKINDDAMKKIVNRSRAVLDVINHEQSGLTMRVIENIAIGKKIVTTNKNIKNEPFYDKNQVFLLGEDSLDDLKEFIRRDIITKKRPELMLEAWLKRIFL